MLSDELKEQTLANHQQLEKMLVGKIKGITSDTDYVNLLQLFYSYFGGLETLINKFISTDQLHDYDQRRKTAALANDLRALGAAPAELATGAALPAITDINQAFGALYVIEGSTLGGSIISKMVAGKLGLQKGLTFFNSYGDASMQMWGIFKQALNDLLPDAGPQVIKSANDTFSGFDKLIIKGVKG